MKVVELKDIWMLIAVWSVLSIGYAAAQILWLHDIEPAVAIGRAVNETIGLMIIGLVLTFYARKENSLEQSSASSTTAVRSGRA